MADAHVVKEVVELIPGLPDGDARSALAQSITDFTVFDFKPCLSAVPMTVEYMHQHMGGREDVEIDRERLGTTEAYNVNFDNPTFVVDRSSIYDPDTVYTERLPMRGFMLFSNNNRQRIKDENPNITLGKLGKKLGEMWRALTDEEKAQYHNPTSTKVYRQFHDYKLIKEAFQKWFIEHVFLPTRLAGSDVSIARHVAKKYMKEITGPIISQSLLVGCFQFPSLPGSVKTMYLEYHIDITNVKREDTRPHYQPWKYKKLELQVRHITYSDEEDLGVHMPSYE